MDQKLKTILISGIISVIVLAVFMWLEYCDSKLLELDTKWILLSGIPILVGLVYSGIIKTLKIFDIELEMNLGEKLDPNLIGKVTVFPSNEVTKSSMRFLFELPEDVKKNVQRLRFILGKQNYYDEYVVQEYLKELRNLRFLEIIDSEGKFIGLIPAKSLKSRHDRDREFENQYLTKLIRSIETKTVIEAFNNMITDTVTNEDSLVEAFSKINSSKQGKRIGMNDQILPVTNKEGEMVGLVSRNEVTKKISEFVLKYKKK